MKFTYTVTKEDEGKKIKEVLRKQFGFSSRFLRQIKLNGTVVVNGQTENLYITVKALDVIGVDIGEEKSYFAPEDIPIEAAYEDDDLLLINKQPGIVVHPTKGCVDGTVANALTHYMNSKSDVYKIRFVNRLDRDTSGLLIVAKNSFVQEALIRQMKSNQIHKKYIAVVKGIVTEDEYTVDLPIGKSPEGGPRRSVVEGGEESVTKFKVIDRFEKHGYTLIELMLLTGRTHQIRVHMSHLGYPVAGDTLYGEQDGDPLIKRQALHAKELVFIHPTAVTEMTVTAALPEDIQDMLVMLRC